MQGTGQLFLAGPVVASPLCVPASPVESWRPLLVNNSIVLWCCTLVRCYTVVSRTCCTRFGSSRNGTDTLLYMLEATCYFPSFANPTPPALTEAMSEHPRVTYDDGEGPVSVDSSRVIFLLVSDVGAEGVNAAVLRYRKRSDVVPVRHHLF